MKYIAALAFVVLIGFQSAIQHWLDTNISNAAVPSGAIVFLSSGTCPSGWSEASEVSGKTVIGTVAANNDVGMTGSSATITPTGTVSQPTLAMNSYTPAGTVAAAVDATFNDFTFSFSIFQLDTGSGCSTASTVAVNVIYTPPNSFYGGSVPVTVQVPVGLGNGTTAALFSTSGSGAIGAVKIGSGFWKIRQLFNNQISFSTTYTNGTCTTQPNVRVYTNLERQ